MASLRRILPSPDERDSLLMSRAVPMSGICMQGGYMVCAVTWSSLLMSRAIVLWVLTQPSALIMTLTQPSFWPSRSHHPRCLATESDLECLQRLPAEVRARAHDLW